MKQSQILFALLPVLLLNACVPMINKQIPIESSLIKDELEKSSLSSVKSEKDLSIEWWKAYGDKQLNLIVLKALSESPNIKSIQARYAQVNSLIAAEKANNTPHVSTDVGYTRKRYSENYIFPAPIGGGTYSLYEAGITLDYTFDFWNARASKISSAKYSALAQKAVLDATKLALVSGISKVYLSWNYDEKRMIVIQNSQSMLLQKQRILEQKYKEGLIDATSLYTIKAELSGVNQELVSLKRTIAGKRESLSILGGFLPSFTDTLVAPKIKEDFKVPLPKEVYLDFVAHRADVTMEKYIVLSKSKNIENAKAQFYPNISLSGLLSFVSFDFSKFLTKSSYAPAAGVALSLPILDGGAREANLQINVSDYNSSVHDYNGAIIKAANEVVGVLKRREIFNAQMKLHEEELDAQHSNETLALKRFEAGLTNKLPYLKAKLWTNDGQMKKIALSEEYSALQIELINALGGGYLDMQEDKNASY